MNQLSWLIYFAGVAGNFSTAFALMIVFGLLVIGCSLLGFLINCDSDPVATKFSLSVIKFTLPFVIVISLITAAIPSKETVYAIAASEIGEEVITNPRVMKTTNKAFDALDNWLDDQIDSGKKKKEE